MAERLAYLEAVVGADITQFRKGMRDIRNETGILSETISGISGAARTATFAISAPLATLGTYTVQAASDFDAAMRNINSITGMSEGELNKLSDAVRDFSSTTRGGAVDAANSLYTVFSAGVTDIELAMNTMEVATKTADAGLADMETTTEALVASMLSYGTEVVSAERASNSLTQMVQIGVGSMQNFANSLSKALPSAAALGVEIEDLYASMAYMTQRSFSASEAATAINQGMSSLMKPTEDMEKAMRSLGANGVEELMEKYKTLGGAVKALVDTTDGSSASIAKLFSNIRGKRFVDTILNDFDTYNKTLEEFNRTVEGATERAYAEQMKSFAAQWDLMTSAVENASIAIGLELLPVLAPVIGKIAEIFSAISRLEPITLKMGVAFAGVAVVLPPLVWLLSSLLNPVGALVTLFGAVTTNMVATQGGITGFIDNLQNAVPEIKTIRREIERIFGEPYQTEVPTAEDLGLTGYETAPIDFATMQSGDTIWDYFLTRTDTNQTWDEFKDEWIARNGKLTFTAGDLVELPSGSFMEWVGDSIMDADELGEAYRKQRVYTSDFFEMNTDTEAWSVPLELQMLQLRQTIDDNIKPAIIGIGTQISGWFGNSFDLALMAIDEFGAEFFDGITNILNLMMLAKFAKQIDTNVMSEKIGELFDLDLLAPFKNLTTSFETFFKTFYDWLITMGLPIFFRGMGRFVSEAANLGIKLLSGIGDFLKNINLTTLGQEITYAIVDPFMQGFDDLFGAKTGTILKNKFQTAGLNVVNGLNSLFDQIKGNFTVDSLSDFIGSIFDIDLSKSMPSLFSGLKSLASNIGTWLVDVGIPMIAKGAGRFISEVAILFVKGFDSLSSLIGSGNYQNFIDAVVTPFTDGLSASFDTAFSFSDFIATFERGVVNIITFLRNVFANITQYISPTLIGDAIGLLFNLDTNTTVLPNITANFSALLSEVGNWLVTDGIPLLAHGVGRLWGEVGVLLGQGLSGLGEYIQNGDFGNATQAVADGFNEAMAENGVTGFDVYLTAFGGAIVGALALSTWYGGVGFAISKGIGAALALGKAVSITVGFAIKLVLNQVIGTAAVAAISSMGWGKWVAFQLGKAVGIGAAATRGAAAIGARAAGTAASLTGGAFAGHLAGTVKGAAAVVSGVSAGQVAATVAVVVSLAMIIGTVFMSTEQQQNLGERIANFFASGDWKTDAEMRVEAGITELDFAITSLETNLSFSELQPEIQTALQQVFESGDFTFEEIDLLIDYLNIGLGEDFDVNAASIDWETVFDNIFELIGTDLTQNYDLGDEIPANIEVDADKLTMIQGIINKIIEDIPSIQLDNLQKSELQASGQIMGGNIMREWTAGVQAAVDEMTADATVSGEEAVEGATQGFTPVELESGDFIIFEPEVDEEQINTFAEETVALTSQALANGMTPEQYKTDVLAPFESNWLSLFGEEGTLKKAVSDFFTEFSTGMATIESQMTAAAVGVTQPATQLCVKVQKLSECIKTSMRSARDEVSNLLKELRKLASISTNLVINVSVTGTINAPDPAEDSYSNPSQKGVYSVPRNGWNATLHRGEMVIPANMADQIRDIGNVPASTIGNAKNNRGTGAQITNVYIEGTVSVDELMEELERRGITL